MLVFLNSVCERFDIIDESFESASKIVYFVCLFDYSYTTLTVVLWGNFFIFFAAFCYFKKYSSFVFRVTVLQLFVDFILSFVFGILKKQVGPAGYGFFPFLVALFFFILCANLVGLTPWMLSATSQPSVTFFLSFLVWLTGIWVGFEMHGLGFYKVVMPGKVPSFMVPFLVVIEFVSYCIRVFSLAIRLSANVTAGHILLFTIAGFVINLFSIYFLLSLVSWVVLMALYLLEVGIMLLQVYVFITLSCIYLNDSYKLGH